jgi:ADP-heptose:LPS heptosyltransferase
MPSGVSRLLVIHPGALGDVLLALPALAHLGRLFPGARRVLAAAPRLVALLRGSAYVEEGADLESLDLHGLFVADPAPHVARRLAGYDVIVSWLGAGDPVFRAHLAGLARSVVARATPAGLGTHASRYLLDTLAPLGPVPEPVSPLHLEVRLTPGEAERVWAAAWLEARGLRTGEAVILHPGAGSGAKAWPGFPALARRLRDAGLPVVVVAGPADRAVLARVTAGGGVEESRIAPDLALPSLAALLREARAFVGNDSGLSHLAAVVGAPSLVLFGPTDPRVWAPRGGHVTTLAGAGPGADDPWAGLTPSRVESALGAASCLGPALAG